MKPSTVSAACASAAIAFGAAALVGWWLDIDLLRRGAPGRVTMNPVTAVVLIVAGAALLLSAEPDRPPPARRLAQGLAALVVLVGGARLGAYLSAWNVPLDGLLFPARVAAVGSRLAQLAALNFVLTGLALALLRLEGRRVHAVLQTLLLGSGLTTLAALLGHLYGADMLHGPMALNTSLAFLALTTGALFARPDEGLVALLRGDTPAGALVRRLLPAVVLIPVVLGWLRLLGQKAGLYETEGGSALFVVTTIVALAGLTWWSARSIERADARRREVEGALRGSEGRFRTLAASANDAIVSADAAGLITYFNPAAERIFEYGASELEGRPITMLMPDRYHDAHLAGLARYLATGEAHVIGRTVELTGRKKDGSEFPVELSLASWREGARQVFTGILRDITDRKQAEDTLRRYAAQLEAANSELDAFAYSVSHDLRAPLRSIDGFSRAVLDDCGDQLDETGRAHFGRIRDAARRMAGLIDDLLNLSRLTRAPMKRESVSLSAIAAAVASEFGRSGPGRAAEWIIAPGLLADGDPRLLRVALENLLENALKYSRSQPQPRIEFGRTVANGSQAYYVRDNGAGFDMAYRDKLFKPFQRLHPAGEFEGSGVGLATVARVIRRHGGRIWAEGEVGRGATFYFTLAPDQTPQP